MNHKQMVDSGMHECASDCPPAMTEDRVPRTAAGRDAVEQMTDPLAMGPAAWDHDLAVKAVLAIEAEAAAQPAPPLDVVYAVAFSNYDPSEVVAIYRDRADADADAANREGPYRVEEWTVR